MTDCSICVCLKHQKCKIPEFFKVSRFIFCKFLKLGQWTRSFLCLKTWLDRMFWGISGGCRPFIRILRMSSTLIFVTPIAWWIEELIATYRCYKSVGCQMKKCCLIVSVHWFDFKLAWTCCSLLTHSNQNDTSSGSRDKSFGDRRSWTIWL